MFDIDLALLNLVERLCRRFQLLTGRTSVWLAFQLTNLSIVVYFVWAGVYFFISEGLPPISKAAHFRKFLPPEEREAAERELKEMAATYR